jgi:autotransporter-associated beta strand protein
MSRILCALLAAVSMASPLSAATYTWGNLEPNGSLGTNLGYVLQTNSNWVGGTTPTFDNQAHLRFTGLTSGTSTTIYGGATTTIMNRMTVETAAILRFNSANSTFSFQGASPTIDVQSGVLRLEVILNGTAGLTKTGTGVIFSNLQSTSGGFTGPFTIEQGEVTSGQNRALGDQKTVNISAGATANMNGQRWGSSSVTLGTTVARNYTFNISGTGNGAGAITNGSFDAVPDNTSPGISGIYILNLDANASVGGVGNFGIAAGSGGTINGNGFTLTKVGENQVWVGGTASDVPFQVDAGTLVGFQVDAAFGGASGSVSVADGATLASSGGRNFANALTFADGATLTNLSSGSTGTWSGNASLTSGTTTVTGASATAPVTMSGLVSGSGGITKTGLNTLTFSNANTYTGVTFISSGTVRLAPTGSIADSSTIRVASGAIYHVEEVVDYTLAVGQILTGAGTVVGDLAFSEDSTVRPGDSPGTLTVTGTVVWAGGGNYDWEIHNATGTAGAADGWDKLAVGGRLDLTGLTSSNPFNINLWSLSSVGPDANGSALNFNPDVNGSWVILTADGGIQGFDAGAFQVNVGPFNGTGGFANTLNPLGAFSIQQAGNNLNLVYSVPEPSAYALALAGLICCGYAVRRRR